MSRQENAPEEAAEAPLFRVVRGNPTEEEIAALTAVVLLKRREAQAAKQSHNPLAGVGRMLVRRRQIGAGLAPGPGSWKRARPR